MAMMPYAKLHGAGNSYVYVDGRHGRSRSWPQIARRVSDPATGLGGDGLIVLQRSHAADVAVRIFNRDGSEAEMCGNGLRGLGKYLYDRGEMRGAVRVETLAGVVRVEVVEAGAEGARRLAVDMGIPRGTEEPPEPLAVAGTVLWTHRVNMGNPHAITFRSRLATDAWMAAVGPLVEHHARFPDGVNFHAATVRSRRAVSVRHWERGSGPTRACGSGACAVVVAGRRAGWLDDRVEVTVPGGRLTVEVQASGRITLTGPAVEISRGCLYGI